MDHGFRSLVAFNALGFSWLIAIDLLGFAQLSVYMLSHSKYLRVTAVDLLLN